MTPRQNRYGRHPGCSRRRRRARRRSSARTSGGSTTSTGTGMPARNRAIQSTSPPIRTSVLVASGSVVSMTPTAGRDLARRLGRGHRDPHERRHLVHPHGDALGHERGGVGGRTLGGTGPGRLGRPDAVDAERAPVVPVEVEGDEVPAVLQRHQPMGLDVAASGGAVAALVVEAHPLAGPAGLGQAHEDVDVGRRPRPLGRRGRRAPAPRRACRPAPGGRSAGPGRAWSGRRRRARPTSGRPTGRRSAARRRRRRPRRRRAGGAGGGRRRRARSRRSEPVVLSIG